MTNAHPYWRVAGAQRDTGADIEVVLKADDEPAAEAEAARLGILVSRLERTGSPAQEVAAPSAPRPIEAGARERLVRVYATHPRDHLYIGWMLRHRKQLVVTSHRVVLHERFLTASRTITVDRAAIEGVLVGRVVRWRVLILTLLLGIYGFMPLPLLLIGSAKLGLGAMGLLGIAVLTGLLLSRADFVGVSRAGRRVGFVRYGVPREVQERFLNDVHSVLRAGADRVLLGQILDQSLRADGRVCPSCRYPLAGLESAAVCPECGTELPVAGAV
jgi:hypothetical protein